MKRLVILLPVLLAFQVGVQPALAWTWPVDGPVLKAFAVGDDPYSAGQHRGIDIGAATGATVLAPAGGTVSFAGTVPTGGRTLTIQTPSGHSVTLLHLGSTAVPRGAHVEEGASVGTVGPSGTPEHAEPYVHLGIRLTSDPNGYVDPLGLLPPRPSEAQPPPAAQPAPAVAAEEPKPVAASAPSTRPTSKPGPAPSPSARRRARPSPRAALGSRAPRTSRDMEVDSPFARLPREHVSPGSPGSMSAPEARAQVEETEASHGARRIGGLIAAVCLAAGAVFLGLRREIRDAGPADGAASELLERGRAPAEDARALRLREQNRVVLDGDLERILLAQAEALPDLDRNDDPAELVDVADDPRPRHPSCRPSRRLHRLSRSHRVRHLSTSVRLSG
jgi:murein DD-endopeptidase MepM/ murein hydrolase activator NlpD